LGFRRNTMRSHFALLVIGCVLLSVGITEARFPAIPSDDDLVGHDMIIIARWNPTNIVTRREETNIDARGVGLLVAQERFTTIEVLRIIKGDVELGHHKIMIASPTQFNFESNGPSRFVRFRSGTSTSLPGVADDITMPCLWVLSWTSSWWEADKTMYPTLTTFYGVQPLEKESHFKAIIEREKEPNRTPEHISEGCKRPSENAQR
jgi:hypothetical protein